MSDEQKLGPGETQFTVFVNGFLEGKITLSCTATTKTKDLKEQIEMKMRGGYDIPIKLTLLLAFAGKRMHDKNNLAFYGIENGSHVLVALESDVLHVPEGLVEEKKMEIPDGGAVFPDNAPVMPPGHEPPIAPIAPLLFLNASQIITGVPAAPPPGLVVPDGHEAPPPPDLGFAVALPQEDEPVDMTAMLDTLEIATSPTGRDMLTLMRQDSGKSPRYIMPCDHIISAQSLTNFARNEINGPALPIEIQCPEVSCDANWPYPLVRKVAGLSPDQMEEFEVKLSENLIERKMDVISCPKCKSLLARKRVNVLLATCMACYITAKRPFYFCWKCRSEWQASKDVQICGNEICTFSERKLRDDVLEILKNCVRKKVGSVENVPEYRSCPKCGQLINHIDSCKHMACTRRRCGTNFCFVCLGLYDNGWPCGSHSDACKVAAIQNDETLPKWITQNNLLF